MNEPPREGSTVSPPVRRAVLSPRGGELRLEAGVRPLLGDGEVLIATAFSVVSAGTERAKLELAGKGLLGKARSRPELVREVLDKARREGVGATLRAVRRRLGEAVPLGYSSAGTVIAVGARVDDVAPGDRVAAGGGGYALHADIVAVPKNLTARVPEGVELDAAAFATLGAVAMHGFRLSGAAVGETVAVVGLGLVGLLAGSVARAAGCTVVGVDVRPVALERARAAGLHAAALPDDAEAAVTAASAGRGADTILICAASSDNAPVVLAGRLARDRARVVVVGDVPVVAPRDTYFAKELELVVSRSYGPGRYDPRYEEGGHDYPAGYVRWTERRNLEAFLGLVAEGRIDPLSLVTDRFPFERAPEAYAALGSTAGAVVLLEYPGLVTAPPAVERSRPPTTATRRSGRPRVGVIGTGSFAERILIPAIDAAGAELASVASVQGRPSAAGGASLEASLEASPESLIASGLDAVFVATRHDSHARLAAAALRAGVPVFVEKPLALSHDELQEVVDAWTAAGVPAMVGFNRRYATAAAEVRAGLAGRSGPAVLSIRVNAGALPADHWTLDLDAGGGRILGEVCHFVDLAVDLLGADPVEVSAAGVRSGAAPQAAEDLVATLRFADGSIATVAYTALGDPGLGKERIEAFAGGEAWVVEDWRSLTHATGGRASTKRADGDKGHAAEVAAFLGAVREGGGLEDAFGRAVASTRATLAVVESLALGAPVEL